MAFTKRLVESFMQTSQSLTSGYQSEEDINRNLAMIDSEIMEILAPLYATNGKVQDLLQNAVKKSELPVVDGIMSKPEGYLQFISSSYNGTPMYPKNLNEIDIINTSPIRKPKLTGPCFTTFVDGVVECHPKEIEKALVNYLKTPLPGSIEFVMVSNEDSDYIEINVVREIDWPDRAFNLFYYSLLEKYGFEKNSQLSAEYSQLGINREIAKV